MKRSACALLAAVTAGIWAAGGAAQDKARAQNFLLEETTVRSGMAAQFEAAQKDYCAAVVRGGAPSCLVYSVATFGRSNLYWTLLPFSSFVHYDQGKYTDKGLTPEQARELSSRRTPAIESNRESAIALALESTPSPKTTDADAPLRVVTEYRLKPGARDAFFVALHRALLPGAAKSGVGLRVFTTSAGESPDRVLVLARIGKFEQLDRPDAMFEGMNLLQRALWETALAADCVSRETFVLRYRAEIGELDGNGAPK